MCNLHAALDWIKPRTQSLIILSRNQKEKKKCLSTSLLQASGVAKNNPGLSNMIYVHSWFTYYMLVFTNALCSYKHAICPSENGLVDYLLH